MVVRQGKYGEFLACSGYPKCKNIKNVIESENFGTCPDCGKPLKKLMSKKTPFYGCSGYPDCKFTSLFPVSDQKCPECGSYTVIRTQKSGNYLACGNKDCNFRQDL